MAAPTIYDGVEGRYEGTLFNGIKFWVAQRVPIRSSIVGKIKDNGGKVVLLEKHADVLIADHARKDCPPRSVSWKYIEDSVAKGELLNIENYRIHGTIEPRPVGSTMPVKGTRVPFTQLDEQILVTWVRRAGVDTLGNKIYQQLAERYPHHTWQSWRDKWVKKLSLLPENQLPPVLEELPSPNPQPGGGIPSNATPSVAALPMAPPAALQPDAKPAPPPRSDPVKRGRAVFTEEDDKLLIEYVTQRVRAGKLPGGNVIYQELEREYPQHTAQSYRSRFLRYLSSRTPNNKSNHRVTKTEPDNPSVQPVPASKPATEPPQPHTPPAVPTAPPVPRSAAKSTTTSLPRNQATVDNRPPPPSSPPSSPPPPPQPSITRAVAHADNQRLKILEELRYRKQRILAARKIQHAWRAQRLRKKLRVLLAISRFQARAQGFLVRRFLSIPIDQPEGSTYLLQTERSFSQKAPVTDEREPEQGQEGIEPFASQGEAESSIFQQENESEAIHTNVGEDTAPGLRTKITPVLAREEFWRNFNEYNMLNNITSSPWAQVGNHIVDFWDLWRCATAEPDHASRDWEVISENLGFNWIAEPHVTVHLKVAFEKYLLGFEEALREFEQWEDKEGEEEEEEGEGEGEEAGKKGGYGERDEAQAEQRDNLPQELEAGSAAEADDNTGAVSQTSDNFISSPPLVGLKRARLPSTSPFHSLVKKRPRYDQSSEIPETPETRAARAGQGTAGTWAAATNQQTPTRPPRRAEPARQRIELETQLPPPPGQFEGADDSDPPTPSRQLLSDVEAASSPVRPPRTASAAVSSAEQPFPSIEYDEEEDSDSSDAFESISNLPVAVGRSGALPNSGGSRPRRSLPWPRDKGGDRGKQAATMPTNTSPPHPWPATAATTNIRIPPPSSSTAGRTSSLTPQSVRRRTPINPAAIMNHFLSQRKYPPQLIARAVKATTCQFANAGAVLDSLARGKGIPANLPGVWTEEEDAALRGIEGWMDAQRGRMPPPPPRVAAADAADGQGQPGDGREERVFWRLVIKHGRERVFGRREFLKVWERA
ncbi:hypothetical protein VTG60DRAFT_2450 [Thermothelomyces hinnuleus]